MPLLEPLLFPSRAGKKMSSPLCGYSTHIGGREQVPPSLKMVAAAQDMLDAVEAIFGAVAVLRPGSSELGCLFDSYNCNV